MRATHTTSRTQTRKTTKAKTPKAPTTRSKTTATTKRRAKSTGSSANAKPKKIAKKVVKKAEASVAPAVEEPTVDHDRIAQLKFSDPDLWAALYADDDDDDYMPMPSGSQPQPASPSRAAVDPAGSEFISYIGEDAPVSFDFDTVSSAPPEESRFSATVSRE